MSLQIHLFILVLLIHFGIQVSGLKCYFCIKKSEDDCYNDKNNILTCTGTNDGIIEKHLQKQYIELPASYKPPKKPDPDPDGPDPDQPEPELLLSKFQKRQGLFGPLACVKGKTIEGAFIASCDKRPNATESACETVKEILLRSLGTEFIECDDCTEEEKNGEPCNNHSIKLVNCWELRFLIWVQVLISLWSCGIKI